MSQLCFDRSSLIINVVLLCAALEVIVPVSAVPTWAGFDFYTWWEKRCALPLSSPLLPSVYLSISPLLFTLFLWALNCLEGGLTVHTFVLTHTHTHTHTHTGLSGVSPERWGYSGWHVSLIYYWSDPAAIIYRSLRDTPLSLSHNTLSHTHTQASLLVRSLTNTSHCHLKTRNYISFCYNYAYTDFGSDWITYHISSTKEGMDFPQNTMHTTSIM